jgi:putative ATPase
LEIKYSRLNTDHGRLEIEYSWLNSDHGCLGPKMGSACTFGTMYTTTIPLAERMRPQVLDDYIGQAKVIGQGTALRRLLGSGQVPSMILWGPPGTGKTTLANIIAQTLQRPFFSLSAISSGVKDVREVIDRAKEKSLFAQGAPILFIDEIHRFSKAQQDSLLGAVEKGQVTLIGATTENPSFEVISALLSRCQVYVLESLGVNELQALLEKGAERLHAETGVTIDLRETTALMRLSGGDGRKLLNNLELAVSATDGDPRVVDDATVTMAVQRNLPLYDKDGEGHYDIISAFIKSIRGSDPNAAVYWLARMVEGGEDPMFIARRLVIAAAEDVGNANPTALALASACFQAVNGVGYPEASIILSQTTVYLATSAKSNATYMALRNAQALVKETGNLPVPLHLRNAPTTLMKDLGYGKDYAYAHDHPGNFIDIDYLPEALRGKVLYEPGQNARENESRERLKRLWGGRYGY